MKKSLIALMLIFLLTLAGCGSPAADEGLSGDETVEATETEVTDATYNDIEKVDLTKFSKAPAVSDFITDDMNTNATKEDGSTYKIAWCNPDNTDESNIISENAMKALAEEKGLEMICFDAQGDPQKQADNINSAVSQNCDAIIINAIDANAMVEPMRNARSKGVKVINVQNVVSDPDAYDLYIGVQNIDTGSIPASMIMDALPEGGKIVMIDGMAGSTAQIERTAGFRGVLQSHPEYEILEEQASPWSAAEAMGIMESYLAKYPEIDAVFVQWDSACLSALEAAESVGRDGEMIFVSADGIQEALDEIAKGGSYYGTALMDFKTTSEIQLLGTLAYLNGDVTDDLIVPCVAVTKDNANEFDPGW